MAITLNNPVVIPATDSKVYDKVWVSLLQISGPNPNGDPGVKIIAHSYRDLPDGSKELGPDNMSTRLNLFADSKFNMPAMMALAQTMATLTPREKLGLAVVGVFNAIQSLLNDGLEALPVPDPVPANPE